MLKRGLLLVSSCLGLGGVLAVPVLAGGGGDVNGDGRTDKADIGLVNEYLSGTLLLQDNQIAAADADGDGKITGTDRELLERRVGGIALKNPPKSGGKVNLQSADSGVVVDQATGQPLAGVEVAIPDEGIVVKTDSEGRFRLPNTEPGKILTAKASNYAPSSVTMQKGGGFQLQLQQLSPRLQVLDDNLYHLGDNNYDQFSANAGQFQLPAQGRDYRRTFTLSKYPSRDLTLRIGSIIGIDTPQSVAAGQSKLPISNTFQDSGLKVFLNNQLIKQLFVNGDNIAVVLPRWLLQRGNNDLRIETASSTGSGRSMISLGGSRGFGLGGFGMGGFGFGVGRGMGSSDGRVDYDDIEFAHIVIEDPSNSLNAGSRSSQGY
ncbi:MAG: carboxypeptidase-like regulatory domain-containing protein [Gemmatimonadaceae bacterium]|nr:carboxypeptidase-like regulatory domain-containing protein [Gloeobacterales cyanobacterium ES-bin-141]